MNSQVFSRFVEVGRVALVTYGPDAGKYVVIVEIIDQSRALVDGPLSGVKRQSLAFKRVQLTQFKVEIPRGCSSKVVAKALEKAEFAKQWAASSYAKKLELRQKRAATTDFDRFKVMLAKKKVIILCLISIVVIKLTLYAS